MDDAARLDARIQSLKELQDLFSAMRALAASRVQTSQSALAGARAYAEVIEEAIRDAVSLLQPGPASFDTGTGAPRSTLVVVCSEHGFAGAFNRLLLERARAVAYPADEIVVVGARGVSIAEEHRVTPAWTLAMATHVEGILEVARQLADRLRQSEAIRAVYGKPANGARFEVQVRQILPLEGKLLEPRRRGPAPLHQLPAPLLLQQLVNELLLAELMLVVTESFASENTARLEIMQAASRNIEGKLDGLVRQSRRARQEAITSELLEVVAGGEAVAGDAGPVH